MKAYYQKQRYSVAYSKGHTAPMFYYSLLLIKKNFSKNKFFKEK